MMKCNIYICWTCHGISDNQTSEMLCTVHSVKVTLTVGQGSVKGRHCVQAGYTETADAYSFHRHQEDSMS